MKLTDVLGLEYDYTGDEGETIREINDLIDRLKKDSDNAICVLENEIEEFADLHNRCPNCGEELELIDEYDESMGEYWGTPDFEHFKVYGCKYCGYKK